MTTVLQKLCSNMLMLAGFPAGPAGKVLLIPEDPKSVLIMVATGTGIAPFRSFWRRLFFENIPSYKFKGLFWLFMGAANRDGTLYDDELQAIAKTNPEQFRLDYALSREQKNTKGGKLYIQVGVACWVFKAGLFRFWLPWSWA